MAPKIDCPAALFEPVTALTTPSSCLVSASTIGPAAAVACAAHISIALLPCRMAAFASWRPALPTLSVVSAAAISVLLRPCTAPDSGVPSASGMVFTASSAAALTASNASLACWMAWVAMSVTCEAASCAFSSAFLAVSAVAAAASCAASPTLDAAFAV